MSLTSLSLSICRLYQEDDIQCDQMFEQKVAQFGPKLAKKVDIADMIVKLMFSKVVSNSCQIIWATFVRKFVTKTYQ